MPARDARPGPVQVAVILGGYPVRMITHKLAPLGTVAAILALTASALAYPGQQLASQAKISLPQARTIAMKVLPTGKVVAEELEKEKGGSGLRYSFDIKVKGVTHEVGVDAKTGRVLENSVEGAKPD